jgi:hypothetical protein
MYGMEPQKGDLGAFEQLPLELRREIAQMALAASSTIDQAIKAIQNASAIYSGVKLNSAAAMNLLKTMLSDDFDQVIERFKHLQGTKVKEFNVLMDLLAKKFPDLTRAEIAEKFKSPIANEYLVLNKEFYDETAFSNNDLEKYKKFIDKGADPSFTFLSETFTKMIKGILSQAASNAEGSGSQEAIQVLEYLLQEGSNPNIYAQEKGRRNTLLSGFKKTAKNKKGPRDYSARAAKVVEILQRYGAK